MQTSNVLKKYKNFIKDYISPLMGISNNNLEDSDIINNEMIIQKDNYLYFSTQDTALCKIQIKTVIPEDTLKLSRAVLLSFLSVASYYIKDGKKNVNYVSGSHEKTNYRAAVQRGIVSWVLGNNKGERLEKLFDLLEEWSVKTYEGKKVTLGFIINPNATSDFYNKFGDWLKFMSEDFVAVFTDCIDSVIELDSECNFSRYLSVIDCDDINNKHLKTSYGVPIRFAKIIETYVTDKNIGVFLLNNGDIILAKDSKITLVKRNLKWLNFSYPAFNNAIEANLNFKLDEPLKQSIYASMLDVSFSHAGGIISVIDDINKLTETKKGEEPILSLTDNLFNENSYDDMKRNFKNHNKALKRSKKHLVISNGDVNRRILKRVVIDKLVQKQTFENINRKLRCELISLDGACIINSDGTPISFGAIIKNDSGSSGGGRGAATRKLSRYGCAIKISTDGYIELYIGGTLKYSIK